MNKSQLQDALSSLGLSKEGTNKVLIARLESYDRRGGKPDGSSKENPDPISFYEMQEADFLALPLLELKTLYNTHLGILASDDAGVEEITTQLLKHQKPKAQRPNPRTKGGSRKIHLGKGKTTRKNRT
jgi:hypothetical protein